MRKLIYIEENFISHNQCQQIINYTNESLGIMTAVGHSEATSPPFEPQEDDKHISVIEDQKQVSAKVKKALQKKVDDHNEKYGDNPKKRTTLRTLEAVFRRGVGAYNTNPQSVRPRVTGSDQWAYARVNSFLAALRTGRFQGGKHDQDLFPKGHPLSSKT